MLEDIAVLTSGRAIFKDLGIKLENVQISDLGTAKKVKIDAENTTVVQGKGDKAEIGRLFDFLGSYVVEHFGAEEKLMKQHAYADYATHKAAHEKFLADYTALRKTLDTAGGGTAALTIKVQNWCGDWLLAHIAGTDQKLATYLGARAA